MKTASLAWFPAYHPYILSVKIRGNIDKCLDTNSKETNRQHSLIELLSKHPCPPLNPVLSIRSCPTQNDNHDKQLPYADFGFFHRHVPFLQTYSSSSWCWIGLFRKPVLLIYVSAFTSTGSSGKYSLSQVSFIFPTASDTFCISCHQNR